MQSWTFSTKNMKTAMYSISARNVRYSSSLVDNTGTTVWWLALNLKGTSADLIKFILQGAEKNKQCVKIIDRNESDVTYKGCILQCGRGAPRNVHAQSWPRPNKGSGTSRVA